MCAVMPTIMAFSAFGPCFIVDTGKSVTILYVCEIAEWCVSLSKKRCQGRVYMCVIFWCNVWVMKVRWGVKRKPNAGISLLLFESTNGTSDGWITINSTYSFTSKRNLEFNPGVFGIHISDLVAVVPSLLVPGRNLLLKVLTLPGMKPQTTACKTATLWVDSNPDRIKLVNISAVPH